MSLEAGDIRMILVLEGRFDFYVWILQLGFKLIFWTSLFFLILRSDENDVELLCLRRIGFF